MVGGKEWLVVDRGFVPVRTVPVGFMMRARTSRSRAKPCITRIVLRIYIQAGRQVGYHIEPRRAAGLTSLEVGCSLSGQVSLRTEVTNPI